MNLDAAEHAKAKKDAVYTWAPGTGDPKLFDKGTNLGVSWDHADNYCRSFGKHLCSYKDYCPAGRYHTPARGHPMMGGQRRMSGQDIWAAVGDQRNNFVCLGSVAGCPYWREGFVLHRCIRGSFRGTVYVVVHATWEVRFDRNVLALQSGNNASTSMAGFLSSFLRFVASMISHPLLWQYIRHKHTPAAVVSLSIFFRRRRYRG